MRPDKPKLQAQQKSRTKDQKADPENRSQPESTSRPERADNDDTLAKLRHREQTGPTIH